MAKDEASVATIDAEAGSSRTATEARPLAIPASEFRYLLALAWPLILSNSFSTIQITIDRLFLSQLSPDAVSGTTSAAMMFWTLFVVFQCTAMYVATFVAQYMGAGRPHRVGPAVWQGLYFCLGAGALFFGVGFFASSIVAIGDHSPALREIEAIFFRYLCWMGLPTLVTAATSAFFSGRGESRTVLWINGAGMIATALFDYLLIFGRLGFPAMGVAGSGLATLIGAWASALVGIGLTFRGRFRVEFAMLSGWRFEGALFARLMRFGLPSGLPWTLDMIAFTAFTLLAAWFSDTAMAATSYAITINNVAFIPMIGVGQAVSIVVGQRLGQDRPDLAEKGAYAGCWLAFVYMASIALLYVLVPSLFIDRFQSEAEPHAWAEVAAMVRVVLWFVALYCLFDSVNLIFSFALRGAGDTMFVTLVSLLLSWPMMVIPTWLAWREGWSFYWAWAFASGYILTQAICFVVRFRRGKWKSMRVIEKAPVAVM
jgi:multidrug resistance protein, MATE family